MSALEGSALAGLDPTLNAPKRLAIMAVLSSSTSSDFGFLRQHLGISDSDLSKQATALETAGYLSIHKAGRGRGGATTYQATRTGKKAYAQHRAALEAILAGEA